MDAFVLTSTILLWPLVLINLILLLAVIRKVNRQSMNMPGLKPPLPVGTPAPPFEAQTIEGQSVTLEEFRGRDTAFVFMSPACKPCIEALPRLNALADSASAMGLKLTLVSGGTPQDTAPVIDSVKPKFPVLVAHQMRNRFFDDYHVAGTPFFCVIDAAGKVKSTGVLSWDTGGWREFVETITRSQPVLKAS